jgi:hypothetical protein
VLSTLRPESCDPPGISNHKRIAGAASAAPAASFKRPFRHLAVMSASRQLCSFISTESRFLGNLPKTQIDLNRSMSASDCTQQLTSIKGRAAGGRTIGSPVKLPRIGPLNGRDWTTLAQLQAGVTRAYQYPLAPVSSVRIEV